MRSCSKAESAGCGSASSRYLFEGAIDPRVATAAQAAVDELVTLGATAERIDVGFLRETEVVQQLIMLPEAAAAHLHWLRTRLDEYGDDVRVRLLAGLLLPGTAVVTGQRARRRLYAEASRLFERCDVLVAPQMPIVAPRIGEDIGRRRRGRACRIASP